MLSTIKSNLENAHGNQIVICVCLQGSKKRKTITIKYSSLKL
jgi:hypothetical protein